MISFVAATDGNANADYGDVSGFGSVPGLYPWISMTVPEPSTITLIAMGAITLLGAKLRTKRRSKD